MDLITGLISERLGGKDFGKGGQSYKFAKIKRAKEEARAKFPHIPIIDLGVGEPDQPANSQIVDILAMEAGKPENRWYSDNGIKEFQEAAANYLKVNYGVTVDPLKEVMHGIGAKSILSMLPLCFINKGDITLNTVPGYPVMATHTKYLGGEVYELPLYKEKDYYPDFSQIPQDVLKKTKLLYLNYPNNPTGQIATKEFYKEVVGFAHKYNIIVVSDATYAPLTFDGYQPLSLLSIDGAKDIGVEIHSLSKAYNMTGWRLAFVAGNAKIIEAFGSVKANSDSGQFMAIQKAGIYALNHTQIAQDNCQRYSRRHDLLVEALREIGFDAQKPKATFYCYVPIPKGTKSGVVFNNAEDVSEFLIKNACISTVPWDSAGSYLRFCVAFEARDYQDEKNIIQELKQRLLKLELVF